MSVIVATRKRTALYLSISGLLLMVAVVSAVSARDPDGVWLRVAMTMLVVGAAMWLPKQYLAPAVPAIWIGANVIQNAAAGGALFDTTMLLELPGLIGLAAAAHIARESLRMLEDETILIGATRDDLVGVDSETGVYEERHLSPAVESEVARARRFGREFALVLVGIDELRQRFDYRNDEEWEPSFIATAGLLRGTRMHIDRVYRYKDDAFALVLPESGEREVRGLVRRLRRDAKRANPPEGEPGGPLPIHFGATFFPSCATTAQDLLRRAEVSLRLAEKSPQRMQLDSAEAPDMPAPETLRRTEAEIAAEAADAEGVVPVGAVAALATDDAGVSTAEPVTASNGYAAAVVDEDAQKLLTQMEELPLADSVSELLKHMDETLAQLKSLRSNAA